MVYAFLDTNMLLHYKVFEGMPWRTILADDDYKFIICQKVFDEIDKHKDGAKTKLRNRAKSINKYLISYLDGNPASSLDIDFCSNPSKASTERDDFDSSSSDEYIVFAAHEFNSKGCRKVIVTGDGGMKLRAMKVGLETILIKNSNYLIAQEPTDEEKKIKQLEKELARYTNRCSKPLLLFEDAKDSVVLHKCSIPDFSDELDVLRSELLQKYPHRSPDQLRKGCVINGLTIPDLLHSFSPYTAEDYETYNRKRDDYIEDMVKYQKKKLLYSAIDDCIQEVKLFIFNQGTSPTGKMGVKILLPEDLVILSEDAWVSCDITPPEPPQLLSSLDKSMIERAQLNDLITARLAHIPYYNSNHKDRETEMHWMSAPTLPKQLFVNLPSLNHNMNLELDSSYRLFIPCVKSGEFHIQWTISDESNIDPQIGTLKIIIE